MYPVWGTCVLHVVNVLCDTCAVCQVPPLTYLAVWGPGREKEETQHQRQHHYLVTSCPDS